MPVVTIRLTMDEKLALIKLAKSELRDPQDTLYLILINELARRGLLALQESPVVGNELTNDD